MKSGWVTKKLGDVCEIIYGYPFNSQFFNDKKSGLPVIRIRDVVRGYSETYTFKIFKSNMCSGQKLKSTHAKKYKEKVRYKLIFNTQR